MKAGWEVKALGDVCDFKGGSQPPKSQFIYEPQPGYVRMLQIRDFKTDNKAVYIPITDKTNQCAETDIMIGRYGASVGQIHRGKSGAYNVALIRTIPDKKYIDQDYLYHYLTSDLFQKPLISVSKRGAQDGFSKPDIAPFQIPLPPLEEQKRIVSILDEAFEGLDRARENAEANLKSARELFESLAHKLFSDRAAIDGLIKIKELISLISGQHIEAANYNTDVDGIGYLTGPSDFGKRHPIVSKWTPLPKKTALANDVLLTVKGSGVGSVNIMSEPELCISRQLMALRGEGLKPKFLFAFMQLQQPYFQELSNGTAIPGISRTDVLELLIPNTPLPIQDDLIELLDRLVEKNLNLEKLLSIKLQDISDLRQSLLQKAFAGELT